MSCALTIRSSAGRSRKSSACSSMTFHGARTHSPNEVQKVSSNIFRVSPIGPSGIGVGVILPGSVFTTFGEAQGSFFTTFGETPVFAKVKSPSPANWPEEDAHDLQASGKSPFRPHGAMGHMGIRRKTGHRGTLLYALVVGLPLNTRSIKIS